MAGEESIRPAGDRQQEGRSGGADPREVSQEGALHGGTGIVEQAEERVLLGCAERWRVHATMRKKIGARRNRESFGDANNCRSTCAVERGADAYQGAAGGDRERKVAGHAHRELAQRSAQARGEVVAEVAKVGERTLGVRGGLLGSGAERSDGHETVDPEIFFGERRCDEPWGFGQIGAEFGGVVAGVDLQENGQDFSEFGGGAIEVVEELFAIDSGCGRSAGRRVVLY